MQDSYTLWFLMHLFPLSLCISVSFLSIFLLLVRKNLKERARACSSVNFFIIECMQPFCISKQSEKFSNLCFCLQLVKKNRKERAEERSSDSDMYDGYTLWFLMQRLRQARRRRAVSDNTICYSIPFKALWGIWSYSANVYNLQLISVLSPTKPNFQLKPS